MPHSLHKADVNGYVPLRVRIHPLSASLLLPKQSNEGRIRLATRSEPAHYFWVGKKF